MEARSPGRCSNAENAPPSTASHRPAARADPHYVVIPRDGRKLVTRVRVVDVRPRTDTHTDARDHNTFCVVLRLTQNVLQHEAGTLASMCVGCYVSYTEEWSSTSVVPNVTGHCTDHHTALYWSVVNTAITRRSTPVRLAYGTPSATKPLEKRATEL